jgi:RND family efflux transporter MFP subunit
MSIPIIRQISEIYIRKNVKITGMTIRNSFLITLIIFILTGCQTRKSNPGTAEAVIPVVTSSAMMADMQKNISISGNIEGYKTVRLGFMVAGKINFIAANEGQRILKGQLISSLDPENYAIAKELSDIQVSQMQDEFNRLKMMHDNKSLSESDFARITFGLQQAKAQQKLHSKNLEETKLYSPIEGVLLKKLCETGEITGVGMPLFVVSDISRIKVNAFIPENELHNINIGQTAGVTVSSLDKTFEGIITEVGSAADPASRAFSVKIVINNPEMLIRPGMIAEVKIGSRDMKKALVIPAEALMHDFNGQSYVYIVDNSRDKALRRYVSPGQLVNDKIEIISGLTENDIVVTGGQQNLVDGSQIIIK